MNKYCIQCGLPDLRITYGREPLFIDEKGLCIFCNDYNANQRFYEVDFKKNE